MTKLDMLVENQNLKKMLEIMREDVDKNCIDCENKMPYLLRHVPENPALAHMAERCNQCVFGKYKNNEKVDSPKPFNIKPLECEV